MPSQSGMAAKRTSDRGNPNLDVQIESRLKRLTSAQWDAYFACRYNAGCSDSVARRQSLALVLTLWLSASYLYLATTTGCIPKASSSTLSK